MPLLTTCEKQTVLFMFDLEIVDEIQRINSSASLITWKKVINTELLWCMFFGLTEL